MIAVEICVQDVAGAATALDGGAHRVELCSALEVGGLTPSMAAIESVRALTDRSGWLHVLVRPRPGGYLYTSAEIDLTCADVAHAVAAGADGVVVGALTREGTVDAGHLRALVDAAQGRTVTFHRAFDAVADRRAALEVLAAAGVDLVLTSCGRAHAVEAAAELSDLARAAAGRLRIMAGGGVRPGDVAKLAAAGCDAIHLSARRRAEGGPGGEGTVWHTDPSLVAAAVAAAATV
ncbi:copper homeostasis protein CutC [Pseudactinotalea suaedae]|uniref:copper homeostasis protein CutC n=1 Tax=Pseudactinotalea suaedae TaxID=1524924 RepID=UPI0012E18E23|nr:copper homeostasis protein CutC [Pseudactinotalea suaedae]